LHQQFTYIPLVMTAHDSEHERQRLAEVYARKADEKLISLAEEAASLTDVARTALCHELDRRGIRHSVRESSPPPQEVEFPSVLTLRQFLTVQEAVMAKSILDSAGIESFLADENVISMNWLWSNALGGVKLQVRKTDVAVASELLEQTLSEAAASADSDETVKE
jgi:Putative prokaryotic signal transducing protein